MPAVPQCFFCKHLLLLVCRKLTAMLCLHTEDEPTTLHTAALCCCCCLQTPALACVEMSQCIAQALPVSVRKGGGKGGDSLAPLLQLPGFTQEVIKKLRKKKINSIAGVCHWFIGLSVSHISHTSDALLLWRSPFAYTPPTWCSIHALPREYGLYHSRCYQCQLLTAVYCFTVAALGAPAALDAVHLFLTNQPLRCCCCCCNSPGSA